MAKGFRQCACGTVVSGPRTKICPECNQPLKAKKAVASAFGPDENAPRKVFSLPDGYDIPNPNIQRIYIPAGTSPIKLKPDEGEDTLTDNAVAEWACDVRQAMINKGQYLENSALLSWAKWECRNSPKEVFYLVKEVIIGLPDIIMREVQA
jgi:hypothetical protein